VVFEFGLVEKRGRLTASATKDEQAAGFLQAIGERLERVKASGVNRGHVAEPENYDFPKASKVGRLFGEPVGDAK
jgi:hypothetical protein